MLAAATTLFGAALAMPTNVTAPFHALAGQPKFEEVAAHVTMSSKLPNMLDATQSLSSCSCGGGNVRYYPAWERVASTADGSAGCIGGCGGGAFQWHADGSIVENIVCWRDGDSIQGLRVKFFDDSTYYTTGIAQGSARSIIRCRCRMRH